MHFFCKKTVACNNLIISFSCWLPIDNYKFFFKSPSKDELLQVLLVSTLFVVLVFAVEVQCQPHWHCTVSYSVRSNSFCVAKSEWKKSSQVKQRIKWLKKKLKIGADLMYWWWWWWFRWWCLPHMWDIEVNGACDSIWLLQTISRQGEQIGKQMKKEENDKV